ncbi:MAG TPA: hypothetical protein VE972_00600 [Conexibacter sp.]|nr:hypothetical protein [Conexibacter sp.]
MLTVAMATVFALSLLAGSASALRSIEIGASETTLVLNGRMTFTNPVSDIICNATVTKTISRAFPKTSGILIGKITRIDTARVREANCRLAGEELFRRLESIEFLLEGEERGRIYYNAILGTLPNITGILFLIKQLRGGFVISRERCLYEPPVEGSGVLAEVSRGVIGRLRLLRNTQGLVVGGGLCPGSGELRETLTPLQTTTIRLV